MQDFKIFLLLPLNPVHHQHITGKHLVAAAGDQHVFAPLHEDDQLILRELQLRNQLAGIAVPYRRRQSHFPPIPGWKSMSSYRLPGRCFRFPAPEGRRNYKEEIKLADGSAIHQKSNVLCKIINAVLPQVQLFIEELKENARQKTGQ